MLNIRTALLPLLCAFTVAAAAQLTPDNDSTKKEHDEQFKSLTTDGLTDEAADAIAKIAPKLKYWKTDRFKLFNDCLPMPLAVEGLNNDASKIGLTEEMLQAAVESRLRSARLYSKDALSSGLARLYVNVTVIGPAFSISVEYRKLVIDHFGHVDITATWNTGSTGTHGRDGGYIVSSLSQHMDKFLVDYLRVNEKACKSK